MADRRWLDAYFDNKKEIYIKNYWEGKTYDKKKKRWEYLLEGAIEFIDKKELEFLREFGAKLSN